MSPREPPSLDERQRDLLYRTRELHRALIAPEGSIEARPPSTSEKAALAVNKGLLKLRRAAYHARSANAAASAPVSRELMRIADSIGRNGLDVQMADLVRIVGAAVAIEAESGEPVARRLLEAVARFDGVFVPQKPKVSARQFIREIQFGRRLRAIQAPKRPAAGDLS
jgi:hypothetical protein